MKMLMNYFQSWIVHLQVLIVLLSKAGSIAFASDNYFLNDKDEDGFPAPPTRLLPFEDSFPSTGFNPSLSESSLFSEGSYPDDLSEPRITSTNDIDALAPLKNDEDASSRFALEDCSLSRQETSLPSKNRLRSRNAVCGNEQTTVHFPESFHDLDSTAQEKIFKNFICPADNPVLLGATIPVCSSQVPENTWTRYGPGGELIHYNLENCFPLMWTDLNYCVAPRRVFCCLKWEENVLNDLDGMWLAMGTGRGTLCAEMSLNIDMLQLVLFWL